MMVHNHNSRSGHIVGLLILCLIFAFTLALRADAFMNWASEDFFQYKFWTNEASAHVLRFVYAYDQVPIAVHKFIPFLPLRPLELLTLPALDGQGLTGQLPYAPELPFRYDRFGLSDYMSFPPGVFVTVWAVFKMAHVPPTPQALMVFNLALQLLTTGLLYLLIWRLLAGRAPNLIWRQAITITTTAIYLISTQTLHSHMQVFWAHHLFQPIFVGGLIAFFTMPTSRLRLALLGFLSFYGAITEFTPWLFNFALFVVALWPVLRRQKNVSLGNLAPALVIAGGQLAAIALILVLYQVNVGLDVFFDSLLHRFSARVTDGTGSNGFGDVIMAALLSYGVFLLWLIGAGIAAVASRTKTAPVADTAVPFGPLLFVMLMTISENLLLGDHTVIYSFSQMKTIVVVAILIALAIARIARRNQRQAGIWLAVPALFSTWLSIQLYDQIYGNHIDSISGKRILESVCLGRFRSIADHFKPLIAQNDTLVMINSDSRTETAVFLNTALQDVLTIDEALSAMARLGRDKGVLVIAGGHDFERPNDHLPYGAITADIAIDRQGETAQLTLYPVLSGPLPSTLGALRFHFDGILGLLEPGLTGQDETGRSLILGPVHDGVLTYQRGDQAPDALPQRITLTVPITDARRKAVLGLTIDFLRSACKYDRQDQGFLPGSFIWLKRLMGKDRAAPAAP